MKQFKKIPVYSLQNRIGVTQFDNFFIKKKLSEIKKKYHHSDIDTKKNSKHMVKGVD